MTPAEAHPPAAPAEGDPPVAGRPEVVEERAAVVDVLAAGPADLLEHVGHRLGDDHVARGDGERVAEAGEASRGAVDREDRRSAAHGSRTASAAMPSRLSRSTARALVQADARLDRLRPQSEREPGRLDVRRDAQEHPGEEGGRRAAGGDVVLIERDGLLRRADVPAGLDDLVPVAGLRVARRDLERAGAAVPGIDALAPRTRLRFRALRARTRGRPPRPARLRPGRGGSAGRPTRSRRSRRCAPLGPCPASPASSTTTSSPGSSAFSCRAVQSPRKPAPTTTTSALVSPSSGRVGSTGPASSSQ